MVVAVRAARWYIDGMNTTDPRPPCPYCAATHVVHIGRNFAGTLTSRCRSCGSRFVSAPRQGSVSEEKRPLIRRLRAERRSLRVIAHPVGVFPSWLQRFVKALHVQTPLFRTRHQRCARNVRKTLSFARKMENFAGALRYFIRYDNLARAEGRRQSGGYGKFFGILSVSGNW